MERSMSTSIKRARASDHFVEANKMVQGSHRYSARLFSFSRNFFFFSPAAMRLAKPQKKIKFSRACVCTRVSPIYIPFLLYFFFIFFLSKERFRKKCPFLRKFSEFIAITSERMGITSEEIAITSERMCFTSEEIRIIGEEMP